MVVETMLGDVQGARFFDECAADPERFADDTRIFAQKIVRATRACVRCCASVARRPRDSLREGEDGAFAELRVHQTKQIIIIVLFDARGAHRRSFAPPSSERLTTPLPPAPPAVSQVQHGVRFVEHAGRV